MQRVSLVTRGRRSDCGLSAPWASDEQQSVNRRKLCLVIESGRHQMIRNFSKIRSLRQFTVDSQEVQIVTKSTIRRRADSLTTFLD